MEITKGLHAFIWQDYSANNCNAYLIDADRKILIDPGHKELFRHVERGLAELKIRVDQLDAVIVTHGHPDHLEALDSFQSPILFAMSEEEYQFIKPMLGAYFKLPEPDFFLREGDLNIGNIHLQVLLTPGHSPGSLCLYWPEKKALFTGDVVFSQGIGRTDLPGGNAQELKQSILKLTALEVEYLLTGHGDPVIGAKNVRENFEVIRDQWFAYL